MDSDAVKNSGWKRWLGPAFLVVAVIVLARITLRSVFAKVGFAAATLDDAYIHFQYARAIAEGHPFRYQVGEPMTSGGTSLLWPAMLAPFYAVGFRGDAILWPAWILSYAALAGLAWEAKEIARKITDAALGWMASVLVLSFGGFLWCAASGMEVVPFAYLLARALRRVSEWSENERTRERRGRYIELVVLAFACALMRPEGALFALFLTGVVALFPRRTRLGRAWALLPAAAPFVTPIVLYLITGQTRSSTATVKWLIGNPYYVGGALVSTVEGNVKVFFGTLLNGEVWSAEFIPKGATALLVIALATVIYAGWRARTPVRAFGILLLAAMMCLPCTYYSFLWNRLRYLWPFATGWLLALVTLAWAVSDVLAHVTNKARWISTALAGVFVGSLGAKLDWVIDDVAQSASGIARQHVALGKWARGHLEPSARVGVNDTGAIAYYSNRKTFDIVGLTTDKEASYWVAGPASRFEHYERLYRERPETLPTHFIVYPEWMALNVVLGEYLHEVTVNDSTILGGTTMRAHLANYSLLGSGARPWSTDARILDEIDVADLESENAHDYRLHGAREGEQIVMLDAPSHADSALWVDGGRVNRAIDTFNVSHGNNVLVMRVQAHAEIRIQVKTPKGQEFGTTTVPAGDWVERSVPLDVDNKRGAGTTVSVEAVEGTFIAYHYWVVEKK